MALKFGDSWMGEVKYQTQTAGYCYDIVDLLEFGD